MRYDDVGVGAASRRNLPASIFDDLTPWLWMGRAVGDELANVLSPDDWEAWTFAPREIPDGALVRYHSGSRIWDGASPCWETFLDYATTAMRLAGGTFVVPDSVGSSTDGWLRNRTPRSEMLTGPDNALYYVVRDPNREHIGEAWSDGTCASGVIGLLTKASVPSGRAKQSSLEAIATAAEMVAFSAYDHPRRPIVFTRK